jgi:flavodoxin
MDLQELFDEMNETKEFYYKIRYKQSGEEKVKEGYVTYNQPIQDDDFEYEEEVNIFDRIEGSTEIDEKLYDIVKHAYEMMGINLNEIILIKFGESENDAKDVTKRALEIHDRVEMEWIKEGF